MARKTKEFTIDNPDSRDHGKVFWLEEMSAAQAEKWAYRAFLALAKSGIELPEDVENAGLAGIATMGLQALSGLPWADAEPLLDEIMQCVQIKPNQSVTRPLVEEDIEEPLTLMLLKKEVFTLHVGFFGKDSPPISGTKKQKRQ